MGNAVGLSLKLDGEAEFKKALGDIESNFKLLGSEMKLAASDFDKNEKSVEALTAKGDVLSKQIANQKDKVSVLTDALAKSAETFGENDERTRKWQIELNNATAKLNSMEREAANDAKTIEELGDSIEETGDTAEESGSKWEAFGSVMAGIGAAVAATAAAVVTAGKQMWDSANEVASFGDAIDKTSQKIGISAEAYQEWSYVFERSGANVDNLQVGMKSLSKVITDAGEGSKGAMEKLSALGLSFEELNGLSQEEQLSVVISRLQEMESGAERTAAASDLLGKSAVDMAAVLNMTAEDTQALIDEAHEYGMVMSNDAVSASATFEDSLTRMNNTVGGVKNAFVGELLPGMTQVMDGIADLVAGNEGAKEKLKAGAEELTGKIRELIPQGIEMLREIATTVLEVAPDIVKSLVEGIVGALPELIPVALDAIKVIVDALVENLPMIVAAAVELIVALASGLGDALPELIPAAIDAILTIVDGLLDNIPMLVEAALKLIIGLAVGLVKALPKLMEKGPEIVKGLQKAVIDCVPLLADAGLQLIKGLWDGIKDAGAWLMDKISGFFGDVVGGIKDFFGIHSPSSLMRDEVGKFLAEGIGEGFGDEMKNVSRDMRDAIPTEFDVQARLNGSGYGGNGSAFADVVIPIVLDGREIARTVNRVQWTDGKAYRRNLGLA